jgi:hypothetical protein
MGAAYANGSPIQVLMIQILMIQILAIRILVRPRGGPGAGVAPGVSCALRDPRQDSS